MCVSVRSFANTYINVCMLYAGEHVFEYMYVYSNAQNNYGEDIFFYILAVSHVDRSRIKGLVSLLFLNPMFSCIHIQV